MAKQAKKRILLISARADLGGGPKQVAEILEYLGGEFDFYVAAPEVGEFAHVLRSKALKYCPLPHRRATPSALIRVFKFIRDHEIDLIHTHGFGASILSILPAIFGKRVIHTFHGLHFAKDLRSKIKIQVEVFLSLLRLEHVCVSKSEKHKANLLGIHSQVIANGIGPEQMTRTKPNSHWPPKIAGVISRLDPFKNVAWVVAHYKELTRLWPDLEIKIAGEGEEKDQIRKLIKDEQLTSKITLLGFQEPMSFFNEIDLLICPSRGEGLPYTVLEAMSYRLPIIASDVPGHNDLLLPECLFSLESKQINSLIPQTQIDRNQKLIAAEFNLAINLKRLGNLYNRVLNYWREDV